MPTKDLSIQQPRSHSSRSERLAVTPDTPALFLANITEEDDQVLQENEEKAVEQALEQLKSDFRRK